MLRKHIFVSKNQKIKAEKRVESGCKIIDNIKNMKKKRIKLSKYNIKNHEKMERNVIITAKVILSKIKKSHPRTQI